MTQYKNILEIIQPPAIPEPPPSLPPPVEIPSSD